MDAKFEQLDDDFSEETHRQIFIFKNEDIDLQIFLFVGASVSRELLADYIMV